jgi:ABC-type uncharacterized transport system permease subunit
MSTVLKVVYIIMKQAAQYVNLTTHVIDMYTNKVNKIKYYYLNVPVFVLLLIEYFKLNVVR